MVTFSPQASVSPSMGGTSAAKSAKSSSKKLLPLILAAVVLALLVGGGYYFWQNRGIKISSGEYQAVFLTNGQVYFGKIAKAGSDEVILKDIYYLILRRPLQTQTPEATPGAQPKPEYTLIKLGQELHGPMDEMRISRDQVLFIEGLKEGGRVVQAIKQHKSQPQEQQQPVQGK